MFGVWAAADRCSPGGWRAGWPRPRGRAAEARPAAGSPGPAAGRLMLSANLVLATALLYVALLFGVAFLRRPARAPGPPGLAAVAGHLHAVDLDLLHLLDLLRRGRLGRAQRAGVRDHLPRARRWSSSAGGCSCASWCASASCHRITSIADMLSSRYGKSAGAGRAGDADRGGRLHALHRAAAQGRDHQLPGDQRLRAPPPCGLLQRPAQLPAGVLDRRRHGGVHHPVRHAQHRRQRAPPRRGGGDRGGGGGQAGGACWCVGLLVVFGIAGGPADIFARMPTDMLHAAARCSGRAG